MKNPLDALRRRYQPKKTEELPEAKRIKGTATIVMPGLGEHPISTGLSLPSAEDHRLPSAGMSVAKLLTDALKDRLLEGTEVEIQQENDILRLVDRYQVIVRPAQMVLTKEMTHEALEASPTESLPH